MRELRFSTPYAARAVGCSEVARPKSGRNYE